MWSNSSTSPLAVPTAEYLACMHSDVGAPGPRPLCCSLFDKCREICSRYTHTRTVHHTRLLITYCACTCKYSELSTASSAAVTRLIKAYTITVQPCYCRVLYAHSSKTIAKC